MRGLGRLIIALALLAPAAWAGTDPLAQDDAGSGRDAPDTRVADVWITPGVVHEARLAPGDAEDWFAFTGAVDQHVQVRVAGAQGCWEIVRPDGSTFDHACATVAFTDMDVISGLLDAEGTWFFHYWNAGLDAYSFSVALDGTAARAFPAGGMVHETLRQDDAGSGTDAPDTPSTDVRVEPGVAYAGELATDDWGDWYAFDASAGDVVHLAVRGSVACFEITDVAGVVLDGSCSAPALPEDMQDVTVTVNADGTYLVHYFYYYYSPHSYRFALGVNAPAPDPGLPLPGVLAPPATAWREAADAGDAVQVYVNGDAWNVRLEDVTGVTSDHVRVPADVTLLQGAVDGVASSWAAFTLSAEGVQGWVQHPGHGLLTVTTMEDGRTRALAPDLKNALMRGDGPRFIDEDPFTPEEASHEDEHDGDCLRAAPKRLANPIGLAVGWSERTLDLAVAVDPLFVDKRGDEWLTDVIAYVNALDAFYAHEIDLRVRLVDAHAHAHGVFPGASSDVLLDDARDHYLDAHADVARDLVLLYTGKDMTGSTVGQASCIGVAGTTNEAFVVMQDLGDDGGRIIFTEFMPDATLKVTAHEIGHTLAAHHHYSTCMMERAPEYSVFTATDACSLMFPDAGFVSMQVSTTNKLIMRGWVDETAL